jgi:hypothetical protein
MAAKPAAFSWQFGKVRRVLIISRSNGGPLTNSLRLVGDGDDLDIVADVERVFGISIAGHEAESTRTVGQLHDLIEAKCGGRTEACLSRVAFYRLRKALTEGGVETRIEPATPVAILRPQNSVARAWSELQCRSGLQLPPLEIPLRFKTRPLPRWVNALLTTLVVGAAFCMLRFALELSAGISMLFIVVGFAAFGVARYVAYLLLRDIPCRIATIGDLARESAGCTFADLSQRGRRASPADRWFALLAILRSVSGHKAGITRDTTFFAQT